MKVFLFLSLFTYVSCGEKIIHTIPRNDAAIEGEYFLRLNTDIVPTRYEQDSVVNRLKTFNVETVRHYQIGQVKILYVKADQADILQAEQIPEVQYSSPNGYTYITQCSQTNAAGCWGLDRSDQHGPLMYSSPTDPFAVYDWGVADGEGVNAYVGDTGIDVDHPDFGGRATFGYTAFNLENPGQDLHGHGTHCAGTIGSNSYGIAKKANITAVKLLNDQGVGTWNDFIESLEWVANQPGSKKLLSLSLSGSCCNSAVEDATNALIDSGVSVIAAAGNSNGEACNEIPAAFPRCITVGASDVGDNTASFSNHGTCVDLYAPGVDVLSTALNEDTDIMSGTSMACPHVAGLVARYMSSVSTPTPDSAHQWVVDNATPDVLDFQSGQNGPNLLLYAPFCE